MQPNLSLYVSQEAEHGRYYLDGGNTGETLWFWKQQCEINL